MHAREERRDEPKSDEGDFVRGVLSSLPSLVNTTLQNVRHTCEPPSARCNRLASGTRMPLVKIKTYSKAGVVLHVIIIDKHYKTPMLMSPKSLRSRAFS